MTKRSGAILASLIGLGVVAAAHARQCKGVDFPEHVQVNGTDLTLNGLGMRKATFLKVNVYVGALYVTRPSHDPQPLIDPSAPAELILHFVRNVGESDLKNAWKEGFERVAKDQMPALGARITMLSGWISDIKTGQRITFVRLPGTGIQVSVDGAVKGTITGDDFSRAFLSIWLGNEPPNPELKAGLLGGPCG
jgi:chalcone isomerase-like protein